MQFAVFADYLQKLEKISSRLEMTAMLADVFRQLDAKEVPQACYLLQGQLLPPYEALEFQISVKTVIKALARLLPAAEVDTGMLFAETDYSAAETQVEDLYKKLGDLGLVAEEVLREQKASGEVLEILDVYDRLFAIAQDNGPQSQQRKLESLVALFQMLDVTSAKFVARVVLGRLRLGFSDMTMIDALSWAMTGTKDERTALEDAYQKKTDIGKLAQAYLDVKDATKRLEMLAGYKVQVGVPVLPALCQRLNTAAEMIEKMKEVIVEPKYDGLRVQIHVDKKHVFQQQTIRTFTRNLEETSHMFPELMEMVETLQCENCIVDAEAVGYDVTSGELIPFQQTITRKRKHGVAEKAKEIPVRFYVFDILALNGEDLLQVPLVERKAKLAALFTDNTVFVHSPELRTTDPEVLHRYHTELLADGLEGAVVKQIHSPYQSGRKGWSWVKIKEAEGTSGKLSDTLDVIVMGYYFGRGKRTDFGAGSFLVGLLDAKSDKIVTIAKVGSGLSDDELRQMKERCDKLAVKEQPATYDVHKMLIPDVWCQPDLVVEVAADEITTSPLHSAGVALRFPRLISFRDDKKWDQATTVQELEKSILKK